MGEQEDLRWFYTLWVGSSTELSHGKLIYNHVSENDCVSEMVECDTAEISCVI